jgi:hypothetical protein
MIPTPLLFLLWIVLAIWSLLCFHMDFRIDFCISRISLEFRWWLHWIWRSLLVIWPSLQYYFCWSMNIGGLYMFQCLPFFPQCVMAFSLHLLWLRLSSNFFSQWFCYWYIKKLLIFVCLFCILLLCWKCLSVLRDFGGVFSFE